MDVRQGDIDSGQCTHIRAETTQSLGNAQLFTTQFTENIRKLVRPGLQYIVGCIRFRLCEINIARVNARPPIFTRWGNYQIRGNAQLFTTQFREIAGDSCTWISDILSQIYAFGLGVIDLAHVNARPPTLTRKGSYQIVGKCTLFIHHTSQRKRQKTHARGYPIYCHIY